MSRTALVRLGSCVLWSWVMCTTTTLFAWQESGSEGEPSTRSATTAREAVQKALPLIQASAREFTRQRECFGCHHQAMSVLAMSAAQRKGFAGLREELDFQSKWTYDFIARNREKYENGSGTGGQADTAGYACWTLIAAGYGQDEITRALAEYLVRRHADRDHWGSSSNRPPTEASSITTTYVALQGLRAFAGPEQRERADQRWEKACSWLREITPRDTEDHVFLLRALHLVGGQNEREEKTAQWLLDHQDAGGGWRQIDELAPDAYASATALAALVETGHLAVDSDAYRRGRDFLLETQLDDGSWHVVTRSKPIQVYFESGFPHEKDQFLSMSATCWAVVALLLSEPDAEPSPVLQVLYEQASAWNRGDIEAFLDSYWKSESLSFSASGETTRGWQATADRFRTRYATREAMGKLTFDQLEETRLGEDAALVLGNWRLDRESEPVGGNFSVVLRRIDGKWVIVHDHTSVRKPAGESE